MEEPIIINNIFITGVPGSGKTTLLEKLIRQIPNKKGFITREIRNSGVRTGFEIVTSDGERKPLAGINIYSPYRVSKYRVDVTGFEDVIDRFFDFSPNHLLYIDEIGKMELFSRRFQYLVTRYLEAENIFIATIAMKSGHEFVRQIKQRNDIALYVIDRNNRDGVYDTLSKYLGERNSPRG
jgi:nucleoside-triphosphatase